MPENRIRFISHNGKQVLLADFSNLSHEEEAIHLLQELASIVCQQPAKSVLVLTDLTDAHYNSTSARAAKEAAAQMTPAIRASAVTGMSDMMGILVNAVNTFAQQEISPFPTREAALEWLTQQ